MALQSDIRHQHEVEHGKYLSAGVAEEIWGWGRPAGQIRARRRAALIMQGASVGPSSKVLEIGCGTGLFTEMFAQTGADILAVDLSPDLLSIARERELPRVQFLERSFENCEVDGPFDAVIGSSVLHHLDLERTWPKLFALLKPGGRMSFAEPNMLNPQIYCERHFRRFFPQVSPDETAFVRTRLHRDLERTGFRPVSIQPFDWLHPATPPALIPAISGLGRALEGVWPVCEFAGSLRIWARKPE
ncbi:MAG TPA: methyltransferase domain-containing protein [Candidatus Acidoferrales bacterium]|jgi:2-polyprenyl-3-methyl-5-hydroxy-6-metoxy-1,4-benzoquinol methylase|nr:methyltransferase domain-containing protein [Candidatus Acidoferrales bacterium]